MRCFASCWQRTKEYNNEFNADAMIIWIFLKLLTQCEHQPLWQHSVECYSSVELVFPICTPPWPPSTRTVHIASIWTVTGRRVQKWMAKGMWNFYRALQLKIWYENLPLFGNMETLWNAKQKSSSFSCLCCIVGASIIISHLAFLRVDCMYKAVIWQLKVISHKKCCTSPWLIDCSLSQNNKSWIYLADWNLGTLKAFSLSR